jgi:hypothetical protein
MKHRILVTLALIGAAILGATLLRAPIVTAAQNVGATITGPLDGQGNVKVHEQGTATVSGTVTGRPAAPSDPWNISRHLTGADGLTGVGRPSAEIDVTSLSASHDFFASSTSQPSEVSLASFSVPTTATECSASIGADFDNLYTIAQVSDPFSASFPTPLQLTAPAGRKACLGVAAEGPITTDVNVSGFYGD